MIPFGFLEQHFTFLWLSLIHFVEALLLRNARGGGDRLVPHPLEKACWQPVLLGFPSSVPNAGTLVDVMRLVMSVFVAGW